jgi:hypothetical protein
MTAKQDALVAIGNARKILALPETWRHESALGQLSYLLEYIERKVDEIHELKRPRRTTTREKDRGSHA